MFDALQLLLLLLLLLLRGLIFMKDLIH